ncbi:MAG: hypothetical protein VX122_08025 [Pseudomonadota bacterium]|nr:hypothetical protein [Pseudomonadota bacterium]
MRTPWGFHAVVVKTVAALALSQLAPDIPAAPKSQRAQGIDVNPLPDFARHSNVREKKRSIFRVPATHGEGQQSKLFEERRRFQAKTGIPSSKLGFADMRLVRNLTAYYEVDAALPTDKQIRELLLRRIPCRFR